MPEPLSGSALALVILAFVAGMAVPFAFGMERLNGFGRWLASKIPYEPPPGEGEEKAMEEASQKGGDE